MEFSYTGPTREGAIVAAVATALYLVFLVWWLWIHRDEGNG